MRKKFIIPIIILIIGIVSFIIINNNKVVSIITLDINPSIEIKLNNKDKVIKIVALNNDAKEIIESKFKGQPLDKTIESITNNIINKGYTDEKEIEIIIYSEGKINNNKIETIIKDNFDKKEIPVGIIKVEKITKEDKELAKKYNISPAKISYIKTITKENENVSLDDLATKSVNELKETKQTGRYCDKGYNLEGDWCTKEIKRTKAKAGNVCPGNTYEYNGKCYEEIGPINGDEFCPDDRQLKNGECVKVDTVDAIPKKMTCSVGTLMTKSEAGLTCNSCGDAKDYICVDTSKATHPVSPCELNDGTEWTQSGGKCYWHKAPIIASGCPGKIQVNGFCWDDASNILICEGNRDGKQYSSRSEYCENSIKYNNPTILEYKCEDDRFTLNGNKCILEETEPVQYKQICPSGYHIVDENRCINNNVLEKVDGYYCTGEDERVEGNKCITYEFVEAKQN